MEKSILTPSTSTNIKTVEIIEEGNKHKCQIQAIKAFIQRYMLLQHIVLTKSLKKLIYWIRKILI